jgi:peptidoglycan/LPS O-acetylase OafA/YrhL
MTILGSPDSKTATTPLAGSGKWDILAGLRFVLALVVAAGHLSEYTDPGPFKAIAILGAFEAIMGFLVISGYSIGASLQKKPNGFFYRRMARIYPVYLASMVIVMFVSWSPLTPQQIVVLFVNVLFLNHILVDQSYIGPAWTLSLEVWLYALSPLLIKLRYKQLQWIAIGSFILYCAYTGGRTAFHWAYYSGTLYGINLPLLAFMWIAGFHLSKKGANQAQVHWLIAALMVGHIGLTFGIELLHSIKRHLLPAFYHDFVPDILARTGTLLLVYVVFRYGLSSLHLPKPIGTIFRFLGDISYPLYLVHSPAYIICAHFGLINCWILISAALLLSSLVYLTVDFYSKKREALLLRSTTTAHA